jgi:hypothetical protein
MQPSHAEGMSKIAVDVVDAYAKDKKDVVSRPIIRVVCGESKGRQMKPVCNGWPVVGDG